MTNETNKIEQVFFIDYENTAIRGLYGISEIPPASKVVIFISDETMMKVVGDILKGYIEYKNIDLEMHFLKKKGKNALDFMLTTYMGYILAKHPECNQLYILSADHGYLSAIDFLKQLKPEASIGFYKNIYLCLHKEAPVPVIEKKDNNQALQTESDIIVDLTAEIKKNVTTVKSVKSLNKVTKSGFVKEPINPETDTVEQSDIVRVVNDSKRIKKLRRRQFANYMRDEAVLPENYVASAVAYMENSDTQTAFLATAKTMLGKVKDKTRLLEQLRMYYKQYQKYKKSDSLFLDAKKIQDTEKMNASSLM